MIQLYIHIYLFFRFFSFIYYYKILNIVPHAIQLVLVGYLLTVLLSVSFCIVFLIVTMVTTGLPKCSVVKNLPASAGDTGDVGLTPGLGRSSGEGNCTPLQYSCLRHPMDRGARQATVQEVPKSQTSLSMHAAAEMVITISICDFSWSTSISVLPFWVMCRNLTYILFLPFEKYPHF